MKQNAKTPGFAIVSKLLIFLAFTAISATGKAQKSVALEANHSTVALQYLETGNNSFHIRLRLQNPQKDLYRITFYDVNGNSSEAYEPILHVETSTKALLDRTYVLPAESSAMKIIVENRKTKEKHTFLTNTQYLSYHQVDIKRIK
jgi:hypothetical protein